MTNKRSPERLLFTVARFEHGKAGLVPADGYTLSRLRERKYAVGDVLLADLRKPVNPGFFRLAHRLGQLVAANIEDFAGLNGHQVLKRIQWEARIACDAMEVRVPGIGSRVEVITPRSLSWSDMGDDEFKDVMRQISGYIAKTYWPTLTAEQIEQMAEVMPEAA
jgi:hypothetical protein